VSGAGVNNSSADNCETHFAILCIDNIFEKSTVGEPEGFFPYGIETSTANATGFTIPIFSRVVTLTVVTRDGGLLRLIAKIRGP